MNAVHDLRRFILTWMLGLVLMGGWATTASAAGTTGAACAPTISGNRAGEAGTRHDLAYDGDLATFFNSSDSDWQYVQIDFNCIGTFSALRRYMTGDGKDTAGNRGKQGEQITYSVDGVTWTNLTAKNAHGWEAYTNYGENNHAWHTVVYGWSAWLNLNSPVQARFVRFHWDDNFDALNEIEVGFQGEAEGITIEVDEAVRPFRETLGEAGDGVPRVLATLADAQGAQMDFVEDELVVVSEDAKALEALLARWQGKILETAGVEGKPGAEGGKTYTVRINPKLANPEKLKDGLAYINPAGQGHFRVSTHKGLQLLAAVAEERAEGKLVVSANWARYGDAVTAKQIDRFELLGAVLEVNCGYMLQQELQLLRQIAAGGPQGVLAEQQLAEGIGDPSPCAPPLPEVDLVANGVTYLPEGEGGESYGPIVLNPPANVAAGFSVEILNAQGDFTSQPPLGGTLYGGNVVLNSDGKQLAVQTQPSFELPDCARSETFTVRLNHAGGATDFTLVLPIRLDIPGSHNYSFVPGQNVNLTLCAAGERGAMNWSWIPTAGNAFPPQGMTFQENTDGNATFSGTPQITSYWAEGQLQVTQGSETAQAPASVRVSVDFYESLDGCGSQHNLAPGEAFRCELPRPQGYQSYTWAQAAGSLPPGLQLVQQNIRWYVEGTVPATTPSGTPVGIYPADFTLSAANLDQLASRQVTFNIGLPFSVLTQNTILRPNNPFVPNTGDDNEERTDMILSRINNRSYDIVALQEVFDDDQRDQLATGYTTADYNLLWGPTDERGLFGEESGLALLVKGDPAQGFLSRLATLLFNHEGGIFADECHGGDCWAYKGFSVSKVPLGPVEYVWVVNTHLQAGVGTDEADTRNRQLEQIMNHLGAQRYQTHPVLLLGDLNIVGGSSEYSARLRDRLAGWEDPVADLYGAALPHTIDKTRNAYAHFWDDHLIVHQLEQIARDLGAGACLVAAVQFGISQDVCSFQLSHPDTQERLDYILVRQGSDYALAVDSARLEDASPQTDLCRNTFPMQDHAGLSCYLSDHYGLSADLRFVAASGPGHIGFPGDDQQTLFLPAVQR